MLFTHRGNARLVSGVGQNDGMAIRVIRLTRRPLVPMGQILADFDGKANRCIVTVDTTGLSQCRQRKAG